MICSNCFKKLTSDKGIFCPNCGAELYLDQSKESFNQITTNSNGISTIEPLKLDSGSIKLYEQLTQKINELQDIPHLIKINGFETESKEIQLTKIKNEYNELKYSSEKQTNRIKNDKKKKEILDRVQPELDSFEKQIHELENEISSLKEKRSNLVESNNQLENTTDTLVKLVNQIAISANNPHINSILTKQNLLEHRISQQNEQLDTNNIILDSFDTILSKLKTIQRRIDDYLNHGNRPKITAGPVLVNAILAGLPPEMSTVQESINIINSNLNLIEKKDPELNLIELLRNSLSNKLPYTLKSLELIESLIIPVQTIITKLQYETDSVKSSLNFLNSDLHTVNQSLIQEGTKLFEKTNQT